jgi:rhodanese-related sulfurtransferase
MWTTLVESGLRQVDAEEALALVRQGAVIVDVRLEEDFKVWVLGRAWQSLSSCKPCWAGRRANGGHSSRLLVLHLPPPQMEHIQGAINVPMFRITAGDQAWDRVKKVQKCACTVVRQRPAAPRALIASPCPFRPSL